MAQNIGKIIQIIGPVMDISFEREGGELPAINDALEVTLEGKDNLVVECQQHIGENTIRCVAMDSTDGLRRGMEVSSLGKPIIMPKSPELTGMIMSHHMQTAKSSPLLRILRRLFHLKKQCIV